MAGCELVQIGVSVKDCGQVYQVEDLKNHCDAHESIDKNSIRQISERE